MRLSLSSVGPSTKVITAGESDRQISCVVDKDGGERGEDRENSGKREENHNTNIDATK